MSNFWSFWIISLTTLTIIGVTWLLFANRTANKEEGEETTGHVYDGIEEYDNPLPLWWFNLFLGSVIFSVIYLIAYPGMGNFPGLLNWTSTSQWQESMEEADKAFIEKTAKYVAVSPSKLSDSPEALKMGKRIFKTYCSTCHGTEAQGSYAFPNLTDSDWLYGGSDEKVLETITNGRKGMMPAWGSILGSDLDHMVDYVANINNSDTKNHPMHEKFTQLCGACHNADGSGNQLFGAPNLRDDVWLYGSTPGEIKITISKGRQGNMPAHDKILSKESIHLVAAYILSLNKKP